MIACSTCANNGALSVNGHGPFFKDHEYTPEELTLERFNEILDMN